MNSIWLPAILAWMGFLANLIIVAFANHLLKNLIREMSNATGDFARLLDRHAIRVGEEQLKKPARKQWD